MNVRVPILNNQLFVKLGFYALGVLLAYIAGKEIIDDNAHSISYGLLILAGCTAALVTLRNWRAGFYVFLVWMMFEDLVRKYLGNGLALFFGKDILLALVYLSFFLAVRNKREKIFRPPFLLFLSLFLWLGVLQIFNQNSPSIWYGLLGFKVYFYYVPLMFLGYALVRTDKELTGFLTGNSVLAILIGGLGIAQAVLGNSFLNPSTLAPDLEQLGNLSKAAPISGQIFNLPDSVFVSSGRYAEYLTIAFIISMGTTGYLLLHTKRNRKLAYLGLAILGVAVFLSGNRGSLVSILLTAVVLSGGFLWGAYWSRQRSSRIGTAIRRSALVAIVGLAITFAAFPQQVGSRLAFFTQTLLPNGGDYQLGFRAWDYPLQNFRAVFSQPHWVVGNGIGTASLGVQYVARLTGHPPPDLGVEEGFGTLIVEMGLLAPILWILWSASLVYYSWRVVRRLRNTRLYPVGLCIVWYSFLLLFVWTYGAIASYENYICNAFLWLLVGMLFRLPELLAHTESPTRA